MLVLVGVIGGQILVSDAVRVLATPDLPGVGCGETVCGPHRLCGDRFPTLLLGRRAMAGIFSAR
jgi:hypothetical protein